MSNAYERQRRWFAVDVTVLPDAAEAIEFAFNQLNSLGTEINHLAKKNVEDVCVTGYFDSLPVEQSIRNEIDRSLSIYSLPVVSIKQIRRREVEDQDWLVEWKKHWKPTEVGSFIIAPPWEEIDERKKLVIRIEPNMAFGTGTHETTQLCLKAIEENYQPGDTFLDVGTGTGILAIATAKLNFKFQISDFKLAACDTDVDSVAIAGENAELNGVAGKIDFSVDTISEDTPEFDFVCANLTLDVIQPMLPLLMKKAEKTLLLSGILKEQEAAICTALRDNNVNTFRVETAGEWISIIAEI